METLKGPLRSPTALVAKGLIFVSPAVPAFTGQMDNTPMLHTHGTTYSNSRSFKQGTWITNRRTMSAPPANNQAYFWTDNWQNGERAADKNFAAGNYESLESANEAVAWLFGDDG